MPAGSAWWTASARSTRSSTASGRRSTGPDALKLHILGIAGTFMGGVAALARELGHTVEGSDQAVYPPMSTQLERLGSALNQGYEPGQLSPDCGTVVIGNALSRGNAAVAPVPDHGRRH